MVLQKENNFTLFLIIFHLSLIILTITIYISLICLPLDFKSPQRGGLLKYRILYFNRRAASISADIVYFTRKAGQYKYGVNRNWSMNSYKTLCQENIIL